MQAIDLRKGKNIHLDTCMNIQEPTIDILVQNKNKYRISVINITCAISTIQTTYFHRNKYWLLKCLNFEPKGEKFKALQQPICRTESIKFLLAYLNTLQLWGYRVI